MIRYRYQEQIVPPAPFVVVTVRNPLTGVEAVDQPAQLDTAADRSLLPEELALFLGLQRSGSMPIGGVGGVMSVMPLYFAEVVFPQTDPTIVEVVVSAGEPWILIGRDILNRVRILFDGPQRALEIG